MRKSIDIKCEKFGFKFKICSNSDLPPTKISSDQAGTSIPPKSSHSDDNSKKTPDQQLNIAVKKIANSEWLAKNYKLIRLNWNLSLLSNYFRTEKVEGIIGIQRLAESHPNVVLSQLHPITLSLIEEV